MVNILTCDDDNFTKFLFKICDFDEDDISFIDDIKLIFKFFEQDDKEKGLNSIKSIFETVFDRSEIFFLTSINESEFSLLLKSDKLLIHSIKMLFYANIAISVDSLNILKIEKKNEFPPEKNEDENNYMSSVNYFYTPNKTSITNATTNTTNNLEKVKDRVEVDLNETRMETEGENLEIEENIGNSIILPCMKTTRILSALINHEIIISAFALKKIKLEDTLIHESFPINKTEKKTK
jgi:hypothetical protein